jgi:hypothetical protein
MWKLNTQISLKFKVRWLAKLNVWKFIVKYKNKLEIIESWKDGSLSDKLRLILIKYYNFYNLTVKI